MQPSRPKKRSDDEPLALVVNFKVVLKGLDIGASLLPSLRAQYTVRIKQHSFEV